MKSKAGLCRVTDIGNYKRVILILQKRGVCWNTYLGTDVRRVLIMEMRLGN
jgi:hypothetical protein